MSGTTTVRFPVRLPPDLHQALKAVAEKQHRSLHSEVLVALEKHVEEHSNIVEAARGGSS